MQLIFSNFCLKFPKKKKMLRLRSTYRRKKTMLTITEKKVSVIMKMG